MTNAVKRFRFVARGKSPPASEAESGRNQGMSPVPGARARRDLAGACAANWMRTALNYFAHALARVFDTQGGDRHAQIEGAQG
jgi:hypothetical protein